MAKTKIHAPKITQYQHDVSAVLQYLAGLATAHSAPVWCTKSYLEYPSSFDAYGRIELSFMTIGFPFDGMPDNVRESLMRMLKGEGR